MRIRALHAACCLTVALAGCGSGGSDSLPEKFTIAVIGDVPYGTTPADTTESVMHPAFIAAINADPDAQFLAHVGDIHSGKQYCVEAYDRTIASDWKAYKHPIIYTPGDNEWADCHKVAQGGGSWNASAGRIDYIVDGNGNKVSYQGGDPMANLTLVRSIFFANPGKDYNGLMDVHSQGVDFDSAHPADAKFVENAWFEKNSVLFFTVNLPGGSNNDADIWFGTPTASAVQTQEIAERSAAILRWIDAAFQHAIDDKATAVVIFLQADMWDLDQANSHLTNYKQFIDAIASGATTFGKPVLLFNGDRHIHRSDNPLVPGSACVFEPTPGAAVVTCTDDASTKQAGTYNVPNFHRITVHGSTLPLEWLKLTIDPAFPHNAPLTATATSFGPFSWQRMHP